MLNEPRIHYGPFGTPPIPEWIKAKIAGNDLELGRLRLERHNELREEYARDRHRGSI